MLGETIGNFKIVERLGAGGMGEVWLAEQRSIGTKVAIKLLKAEISDDTEHVERFFNEARAVSRIQHAGIVKIFDVGHHAGRAYLIMECLEGETLARRIRGGTRLAPIVLAEIARQIASVLEATHGAGITHRDLKPDNIYLVRDPSTPGAVRVKVLDFGIAKLGADRFGEKAKTKGGTILGTPAYMAPEQCKGTSDVDARADLYAVGCILFELLTGRPPFVAQGGGEIMAMHIYEPPPRLSTFAPHLPPDLEALVAKLLVKNPADRMPSAAYTLAALERIALPPVAEVMLRGERLPTYSPAAAMPTVMLPVMLPDIPPLPAHSRLVPIAVLLIALAIAAAAVVVIGFA